MPTEKLRKPTRASPSPSDGAHRFLKKMDFWVGCAYLVIPLLLGLLGGVKMILLVMFIYPVISVVFFVVRHRYLQTLSSEQRRQLVPYSHVYIGRGISMVILFVAVASCVMALLGQLYSGR